MLHALNPGVPESKVQVLSDWCNDHYYDHYRFLYSASTLALEGLLHYADPDIIEALGVLIYRACHSDKHKFMSVLFTLKAMISVYHPQFVWVSQYDFNSPDIPSGKINGLAGTCRRSGLGVSDLLDVAVCRALVEELMEKVSLENEEAELNLSLLIESADAGKIVGRGLKGQPLEDRMGILLRIIRKMTGNILGICGKEN